MTLIEIIFRPIISLTIAIIVTLLVRKLNYFKSASKEKYISTKEEKKKNKNKTDGITNILD